MTKYQIIAGANGAQRVALTEAEEAALNAERAELKSLPNLKANKLEEIAQKRWKVETGGIVLNGIPVQTGRETVSVLNGARFSADKDPNFTVDWKAGAGQFVTLDAAAIVAVADAVRDHVKACFTREKELALSVNAALDEVALEAIDIEVGWPGSD